MSGKSFSLEFKLAALGQIDDGESVARVARDFGVSRKTIYQWRDQLRQDATKAAGEYRHDIRASMSRLGNPYDNAKAERFMRTLKQEEVDGSAYRDAADARAQVASFIEIYNRQRLHSALDYLSPDEYEETCSGQRRAAVLNEHNNRICHPV